MLNQMVFRKLKRLYNRRKRLCIIPVFFLLYLLYVSSASAEKQLKITNAKNQEKALYIGRQFTIQTNYQTNLLEFSTNNLKVACVSTNGIITARKTGKAVITVKTKRKESGKVKLRVTVRRNKKYKLPVKSRTNSGMSDTIPYIINSKGNRTSYDKSLTMQLGSLIQSYSSGAMNNLDAKSQQYCLTKEHFIFLNEVSEKWVRGAYSRKKALKLASNTKFYMRNPKEEPAWSLVEGTVERYEVKSKNAATILDYIGKTNNSAFMYVYTKCFYDKKTGLTTVYLVNGRIWT